MTAAPTTTPRMRPFDALVLLLASGLFLGLLDSGWYTFDRVVRHHITYAQPEGLYLAPLVYAGLCLLLGLPLVLLGARWEAIARPGVFAGLAAALGTAMLLFMGTGGQLDAWAIALVSLGIGVRGGPWLGSRLFARLRGVRLFAGVVSLLVLVLGARDVRRLQVSPSPRGATSTRPNVLLIILDTVRAQSLSLYGHSRPTTPRLAAFAQGGVVFDSAMSTAPWTLPSHASMFTGHYHQEMSTDWRVPLLGRDRVLAEAFKASGYETAGFVANLLYTNVETGLARGFDYFRDYIPSWTQAWYDCTLCANITLRWANRRLARRDRVRKDGARVSAEFLSWLDARKPGRFFAFLNYYDAHLPRPRIPKGSPWDTGNRVQDRYDHSIHLLDDYIGDLMDSLRTRGILDSTIVIIASDHGELLGEHGLTEHGNGLYLPELHVPLLMRGPGIPAGMRVRRPVSLRDLAETIRGVAGLPGPAFPGASLAPLWLGPDTVATSPVLVQVTQGIRTDPEWPVTRGTMNGVIRGDLHYILGGDGKEELFRLSSDPAEEHNLAGVPSEAAALETVRAELRALLHPGWQGSKPVPAPGAPAQGGP